MNNSPLHILQKREILKRVINFYQLEKSITYYVTPSITKTLDQNTGFCTLIVYYANKLFDRDFIFMSDCIPEIRNYRPKPNSNQLTNRGTLYWFERGNNIPRILVLKQCLNDLK